MKARGGKGHGFWAGLLASLPMVGVMLLLRLTLGIPSLPELLSDRVITLIPLPVFSFLLELLRSYAKQLLFFSLLSGQILAGGLLGMVYSGVWARERTEEAAWKEGWRGGLGVSLALWILTMALLLPLLRAGFFGASLPPGALPTAAAYLLSYLLYGLPLSLLLRRRLASPSTELIAAEGVTAPSVEGEPLAFDRRSLLKKLGWGLLGLIAGGALWNLLSGARELAKAPAPRRPGELTPEVTPNERFYVVSKNFIDPSLDASQWRLEVKGLVERPLILSYEELKALPAVSQYVTLECISNTVGGDLMSNALWRGVPLRVLLERAWIQPGVKDVLCAAADGYTDSITLEKALDSATLVAYEMNGVPLPQKHGFPARLIVPGIYGMKNVKWLTSLELVDYDYKGYWEEDGWSDSAVVKTTSRTDLPRNWEILEARPMRIGGVAFAGDRGIARVEVSTDGGITWREAQLKEALSPYTWVLWTQDWEPKGVGAYHLVVRATDKKGALQIEEETDALPDGATGYHSILVRLAE